MSEKLKARIGVKAVDILHLIGDIIVIWLVIFYSNIESIFLMIIPKPLKSVKEEIVLITGSGHGMGRELCLLYAEHGATVVGLDINEASAALTCKDIEDRGHKAYHYPCDVSNREHVLEVANKIQREVGDVTILINNAGIMPTRPFLQQSHADIEKMMGINVMAHFWTLEAFLPKMKQNNHGHIVSMSSVAGLMGVPNIVPYCASKYAVRGLMEGLMEELRQDKQNRIQITTIYPYIVDTGLCERPVIKYKQILPMIEPKSAAVNIMNAQRTDMNEVGIPKFILYALNYARMLPARARKHIIDSIGTAVH